SLPSSPARRLPLSATPFTAAKAAGRRPPAPCLCDPAGPLACTSRRAAAPAPGTRSAPDPVILSGLSRAAGPPHRPLGVDPASPLRVVVQSQRVRTFQQAALHVGGGKAGVGLEHQGDPGLTPADVKRRLLE